MRGHEASDTAGPSFRPSLLQECVDGKVRCGVCERRCLLVPNGTGWCRTRVNRKGILYTVTYGMVSSLSANPIEKKPLYHFYPASRALTAGSWGCNFGCLWCQNWSISKQVPASGGFLSPEGFVREAQRLRCQGTSISFNEPTLSLEWSLDVFRLARKRGLYNTFVTNGYMSGEALRLLVDAGLDGMNVDIKGDASVLWRYGKGINAEQVWARCQQARALGVHVEVTSLLIPGVNDQEEGLKALARRIVEPLGPDTPWHVTAYFPAHRFKAPPTPIKSLEKARDLGLSQGLRYVYVGNTPGHPYDNTYCPDCGALLIVRFGFSVLQNELEEGRCPSCGHLIPGRGWSWRADLWG